MVRLTVGLAVPLESSQLECHGPCAPRCWPGDAPIVPEWIDVQKSILFSPSHKLKLGTGVSLFVRYMFGTYR